MKMAVAMCMKMAVAMYMKMKMAVAMYMKMAVVIFLKMAVVLLGGHPVAAVWRVCCAVPLKWPVRMARRPTRAHADSNETGETGAGRLQSEGG